MAEEIGSIYEQGFRDHGSRMLSMEELAKTGYPSRILSKSYEYAGVREKLMDMAQAENRIPTDAIHLGLMRNLYSRTPVLGPYEAIHLIAREIADNAREESYALLMDENCFPLAICSNGIGDNGHSTILVEEILKCALLSEAKKVIMIHCHPCLFGSPARNDGYRSCCPSGADFMSFKAMKDRASIFGIEVMDSVIVSERDFSDQTRRCFMYSIREEKLFTFYSSAGVERKTDERRKRESNHIMDFDENGKRIHHKEVCLTPDGVFYAEEEDEEREQG